MNALKGHALAREGAVAYDADGCEASWLDIIAAPHALHARCECGALSPPDISRNAAKRWHRQHKADIRRQT